MRGMEEEVRNEEEGEKWERERREREERDREKTRKNREKRERLKNKKNNKGGKGGDEVVGEKNAGKIKARVEVGRQPQGLGGEGPEGNGEQMTGVASEEVGIVIHDDD